jgi:hypothetical protein
MHSNQQAIQQFPTNCFQRLLLRIASSTEEQRLSAYFKACFMGFSTSTVIACQEFQAQDSSQFTGACVLAGLFLVNIVALSINECRSKARARSSNSLNYALLHYEEDYRVAALPSHDLESAQAL